MTAQVVPIRAGLTPEPPAGETDEALIKELSDLLERAKSGEIIGIAYAVSCPGHTSYFGRFGHMTRGVIGAMEMLKHRMVSDALE